MKKIFLHSFFLVLVFIVLKPTKAAAQPYCPMWIVNNSTQVGLGNDYVWSTFAEGMYYVTLINSNPSTGDIICMNQPDELIQISKTQSMGSVFPGAPTIVKGLVFNFSANQCGGLPDLNQNGTSIIVRQQLGGNIILQVDYTFGFSDFCDYIVVPVTFGTFTATPLSSPTRVKLDWSTYSEAQMDHFTVEKSLNGSTWYKIGHVAAAGNTNWQTFYSFTDNYPSRTAFYRIISVDQNCYKQYTPIRTTTCSACGTTLQNPVLSPDCISPQPYITGLAANCSFLTKAYRLVGLTGSHQITWSFSNPNIATLTQAGRLCVVTPTGQPGVGTLTATAVRNGITTTYSFNITLGVPEPFVWESYLAPTYCQMGEFTATVYKFPGTSASEYKWYRNGSYLGSGESRTWTLPNMNTVINYEVRWNGPCGTSVHYGSSGGALARSKTSFESDEGTTTYQIATNPARSSISITRRIPPCPEDPAFPIPFKSGSTPSAKSSVINTNTVTIKVFDLKGNLHKAIRVSAGDTKIQINAGDLPAGVYLVHIIEGTKEEKLKVLLEK